MWLVSADPDKAIFLDFFFFTFRGTHPPPKKKNWQEKEQQKKNRTRGEQVRSERRALVAMATVERFNSGRVKIHWFLLLFFYFFFYFYFYTCRSFTVATRNIWLALPWHRLNDSMKLATEFRFYLSNGPLESTTEIFTRRRNHFIEWFDRGIHSMEIDFHDFKSFRKWFINTESLQP